MDTKHNESDCRSVSSVMSYHDHLLNLFHALNILQRDLTTNE